jgi:hypothetical protein
MDNIRLLSFYAETKETNIHLKKKAGGHFLNNSRTEGDRDLILFFVGKRELRRIDLY